MNAARAVEGHEHRPTPAQIRRWRRHLADELAEAEVYRDLAARRTGAERAILLGLEQAEARHAAHWQRLLGDGATPARRGRSTRLLGFLARRFGFVFALALAGRAESRSAYARDPDAPPSMAADEEIHAEVVRGLAARGRAALSGTFRAAVFGINDGLVSNLSLVIGVAAAGVDPSFVLLSGVAGLLAGALSMAAGEYVSVRSQRELLAANRPNPDVKRAVAALDAATNELALVYRSQGADRAAAEGRAAQVLAGARAFADPAEPTPDTVGTAMRASIASFFLFSAGAALPILPYAFGLTGWPALGLAAGLVGAALLATGGAVGLLSGAAPLRRALRQLAIGYGAACVTYAIGSLFGVNTA
ncbi:MAG: VIT1/CCC1 family protein [Bifidobacteriaceae bacterium]|nr:VIT1/CCC1 family protein [Bifidobacteriaceae bacterium]